MAGYIGSRASVVSSGAERKKTFDITTTTTVLTGLSYTPTFVHLFHNGVRLVDGTDYTATDSTSITLTTAAENGDQVVVVSYATFQAADAYTKAEADAGFVSVAGDTMTGGLTVGGPFTSLGIDDNAAATAVTIAASGNVGIGTDTPAFLLTANSTAPQISCSVSGTAALRIAADDTQGYVFEPRNKPLSFSTNSTERMRIGGSGDVLVGKTSAVGSSTVGHEMRASGLAYHTADNSTVLVTNRTSTDGAIVALKKDDVTVGSIGANAGQLEIKSSTRTYILGTNNLFALHDNVIDLGSLSFRFDDVFATNGTIQTSDRNEKEAIASLTPTEMLVAARLSSSFKNFKWKDAVAEKGAAARMHSGIIAQDVQDAFTAEGLDASDYAMFISGTWWEHEGTTYDTLEEAPEGATERTRLGVRYPELLAFVAAYSDQRFLAIEARLTALEAKP